MKKEYRVIGINYKGGFTCSQNLTLDLEEENPTFALAKAMRMRPSNFDEVLIVNNDLELVQMTPDSMVWTGSKHGGKK